MEKERYEELQLEVVEIENADVITESSTDDDSEWT